MVGINQLITCGRAHVPKSPIRVGFPLPLKQLLSPNPLRIISIADFEPTRASIEQTTTLDASGTYEVSETPFPFSNSLRGTTRLFIGAEQTPTGPQRLATAGCMQAASARPRTTSDEMLVRTKSPCEGGQFADKAMGSQFLGSPNSMIALVAGAGFEPATFGL
jgi:hypothetical protein